MRCSAIYKGGQWRGAKIDRIIKDIASPFDLQVQTDTDIGDPVHDFKLWHGETALDAISRAARLRGVLVTRDNAGRLLLTKAGKLRFKGAIVRGQNVISMQGMGSDDNRHSHYFAYGQCNTVADFETARSLKAVARDGEMQRYLPLVINADGNTTQAELQTLVAHTMRVRRGQAMGLRYVVEGWTFEGAPWPLNQRVPIYDDVAGITGQEWLICAVKQTCSLQDGDVTELTVRPVEAYDNKGNTSAHPRGPSDKAN